MLWIICPSTLIMVAACSPDTLVHYYQTTQHHILEGSNHHSHCLENPKSQKKLHCCKQFASLCNTKTKHFHQWCFVMKNFKIKMNLRFFNVLLFLWRGDREKGIKIVVNMKDKFMEVSFSETLQLVGTNGLLLTSFLFCYSSLWCKHICNKFTSTWANTQLRLFPFLVN